MDITPDKVGKFDVVMFLGVLYHLQDPMAGLRIAADVCEELLIIETQMDDLQRWKPSMVYYPGDSFNNDSTNYWAPNVAAMKGMLMDLGFSRVEVVYPKRPWLRYARPIRYLSSLKGVFEGRGSFPSNDEPRSHVLPRLPLRPNTGVVARFTTVSFRCQGLTIDFKRGGQVAEAWMIWTRARTTPFAT